MCPICWTIALLSFFGIAGTGFAIWAEANTTLMLIGMLSVSGVFWGMVYMYVSSRGCQCRKKGEICQCGQRKQ